MFQSDQFGLFFWGGESKKNLIYLSSKNISTNHFKKPSKFELYSVYFKTATWQKQKLHTYQIIKYDFEFFFSQLSLKKTTIRITALRTFLKKMTRNKTKDNIWRKSKIIFSEKFEVTHNITIIFYHKSHQLSCKYV